MTSRGLHVLLCLSVLVTVAFPHALPSEETLVVTTGSSDDVSTFYNLLIDIGVAYTRLIEFYNYIVFSHTDIVRCGERGDRGYDGRAQRTDHAHRDGGAVGDQPALR